MKMQTPVTTPVPNLRLVRPRVFWLATLLWLGVLSPLKAETPDPPVPLFSETNTDAAPLALEIHAPWRRLRHAPETEGPFPALLRATALERPVTLTVEKRGISRQEICDMPPIRLRFDEADVAGTLFAGNRAIKVVTHCNRGNRWEQYVALEYLAYRLYNAMTEMSFRVRPVTITYEDSERNRSDGPRIAFLIEDDRLVGNRHGLDKVEVRRIRPSDLPPYESSVFSLFQFMIGNVDFSALSGPGEECCHNVKLIGEEGSLEPLYAVPYDFDSSGWVDTDYAAPPKQLPIRDVRQRLFRGLCEHNAGLEKARELFQVRRDRLFAIVESEPQLSSRQRRNALRYLGEFFDVLDDDRHFERQIIRDCRS